MKAKNWLLGIILSLVVLLSACSQTALPENTVPEGVLEPEIVGGTEATAGAFPFMARLSITTTNGVSLCAGSLLHREWVVTAAHCVRGVTAGNVSVILGDHRRSVTEGTEQTRTIAQIIVHPEFNATTLNNDIALLRLSVPATLNARVDIATIAPLPDVGTMLRVIGWGRTSEGGTLADRLQQVDVPLVAQGTCADTYPVFGNPLDITASMFCAGPPQGLRDACNGDSGGPIFLPNTRRLVGLVSWGIGCARPNLFGVYTNLGRFTDFIFASVPRPTLAVPLDLIPACRFSAEICKLLKDGNFLPPPNISPSPSVCQLHPDVCSGGAMVPILPDKCIYAICNNPMDIPASGNYKLGLAVTGLGLTPTQFAQSFQFELVDASGKLVTQAKLNAKVSVLELSSSLAKGSYNLRVKVLNQDVAKKLQATPGQYSFSFLMTAAH